MRLFAEKGYASTSIQDVADAIGVLKGSLYHYIDSKEDLLFEIFHRSHIENEQLMVEVRELDVDPVVRLRTYLERSMRTTVGNLDRTTLYFRDWKQLSGERLNILTRHRKQYDRFLRDLIKETHEALGITPGHDVKYMSSFIIGATNWLADWYRKGDVRTAEEVIRHYTDLAMVTVIAGGQPQTVTKNTMQ